MNWDRIEGNWKQMTGKVREQWGKLTDDDLDKIDGIASTETWNVLRTEKFFYNWEGEDVGLDPLPQRVVASPDGDGPPEG